MFNVLEFFANLPKKKCRLCKKPIEEQADCYSNLCHTCNHPAR